MYMLTDIQPHDSVHLNVYSLLISMLNILVNNTDCCLSDGIGWNG